MADDTTTQPFSRKPTGMFWTKQKTQNIRIIVGGSLFSIHVLKWELREKKLSHVLCRKGNKQRVQQKTPNRKDKIIW